jgi:hypothetical protein
MFVKVKIFGIESKSKRTFEKSDMHLVIIIELMTIVLSIIVFEPKLVLMFFHMDSIREFKSSFQCWSYVTIVVIIVSVRGGRDSKGERQLLIVDGEGEFEQNVLILGNNFKTYNEQLFEAYNGGQCIMVLIKNMVTISKGD